MEKKTALLFGSTGLTGGYLLQRLLMDSRYEKIKVFVRKKIGFPSDKKLEEHVVKLSDPETFAELLEGDDLFCCLGTTLAKAGSKEAFRKVDFEIPVKIAEASSKNNVPSFIIISSLGANATSSNFYLRTKGEMEEAVRKYAFRKTAILRPSMLLGGRKEFRFGESAGKLFMQAFGFLFIGGLKKYKAIQAKSVARAMIEIANGNYQETVFESDRIREIAMMV